MSELRYNHAMDEWVVIATERARRPDDFKRPASAIEKLPDYRKDCPFCPGNEGDLSDETFRIGDKNGWRVRSVLNKFPAFDTKKKLSRKNEGGKWWMQGFGVAEVIVETPYHNRFIALMDDAEVCDIIRVYKERYIAIGRMDGIEAVTVFKNHGPMAGTSQVHPHSQIIATPVVPTQIRKRIENATWYFDKIGECMFCFLMKAELESRERIVFETDKFVSFVPYAASGPFTMWIIPRRHMSSFTDISEDEVTDLAKNLRTVLGKLYRGLGNPDFNYVIRSAPVNEDHRKYFHWFINVIPRINQPAGFELGSGMFINTSLPEECAEFLRRVA